MIGEKYKNYTINVYWRDSDFGFRFRIYNAEKSLVYESSEAYFYDYNATKAAKEAIDDLEVSE